MAKETVDERLAERRAELKKIMQEQLPKLEAAKKVAEALKEIGEDTSGLDKLIAAATALTTAAGA